MANWDLPPWPRHDRGFGGVVFLLLAALWFGRGDAFQQCSWWPVSSVLEHHTSNVGVTRWSRHQVLALAKGDDAAKEEKRRENYKRGAAAIAQKLVESGKAATPKEANRMRMARAREAKFAKYTEEEISELGKRAAAAAAQRLVNSGEAATIEEALDLHASRMREAMIQNVIDSGNATTVEEASSFVAARAREAFEAKYTEKEIAELGTKAGVASAIKLGKRTKYPGVTYHEASGKWQVRIYNRGKRVYVGLYVSESEAAKAHDEYVRKHGLHRPLHFPRKGETSSQSSTVSSTSRRGRQLEQQ